MPVNLKRLSEITPNTPTRTDQLVGVKGGTTDALFPISGIGRTPLLADATFYVTATGSDSGDGSLANPWATPQHGLLVIAASYDISSHNVILSVGPGLFNGFGFPSFIGGGNVQVNGSGVAATTIQGNAVAAPPLYGLTGTGGGCVEYNLTTTTGCGVDQCLLSMQGPSNANYNVIINASGGVAIGQIFDQTVDQRVDFLIEVNSHAIHTQVPNGQVLYGGGGPSTHGYGVVADLAAGFGAPFGILFAELSGQIVISVNSNVSANSGTANWKDSACRCSTSGEVVGNTGVFIGTATGFRFLCEFSGDIDDNFAGINWFPGNTQGECDANSNYGRQRIWNVNTYVDTDHTLAGPNSSSDYFAIIQMQSAAAHSFLLPTNASMGSQVPPIGLKIPVVQTGAGVVTIAPTAGNVTTLINGVNAGFAMPGGQFSSVTVYQNAVDSWIVTPGI